MQFYHFERLIRKYSVPFTLVSTSQGEYVDGVYKNATESRTERIGAIISQRKSKDYGEGGTFSDQDRVLYMLSEIEQPLKNSYVIANGNKYNIETDRDKGNEIFTGVYVYLLKWVECFNGGVTDD